MSESGAAFKLRRLVEAGEKLDRLVNPPVCNLVGGDRGHDDCDHGPSSPTPPTSPHKLDCGDRTCEACYTSEYEPTPPSEEPRPTAEATHRCKVCGANWRLNPPTKVQPGGSWSLVWPYQCGKCCDNVAMADQIEAIGEPLRCAHCREEIRPEGEGWMDAETCTSCEETGRPHEPVPSPEPPREEPSK